MVNVQIHSGIDPIKELAQRAYEFCINLDGRVTRDNNDYRQGGFATVYKGKLLPSGTKVAVKTVHGQLPGGSGASIRDAVREVHTWSKLRHKNILSLLGITTEFDRTISIVSEWMDMGNAHDYVQNLTVDPRPLVSGIAHGLQHLHDHRPFPIYHGDLKGANVLISADGRALLTDFGLSRAVNSSLKITVANPRGGSLHWIAPENLDSGEVTAEGDVWAFGMTTLELFTRKLPYGDCQRIEAVMFKIVQGPPDRPSMEKTCSRFSDGWWELCCSCWNRRPELRPSMPGIVKCISNISADEGMAMTTQQGSQILRISAIELHNVNDGISAQLIVGGQQYKISGPIEEGVLHTEFVSTIGIANIEKPFVSSGNQRFILHDTKGFEPGESDNLSDVKSFITRRKDHEDIKEQLHAVWLSFQIPLESYGERMMETGMEDFLRQKKNILADIPTVFVFTKYDKLADEIESRWVDAGRDYTNADVDSEAQRYLEEKCVKRICQLTGEQDPLYIAVSTKIRYQDKLKQLIKLTYNAVSDHFVKRQGNTGPSAVSTVTIMAQRVNPLLNIEELINVGKQRYWEAVTFGGRFTGQKILDCLQVIHTDIVNVWNFCDPNELLLSKEFRDCILQLVDRLDEPPRNSDTNSDSLSWMVSALKWPYQTWRRVPKVQRKFMAYIVDLTHVMDILFTLTASRSDQDVTLPTIRDAFRSYSESDIMRNVHTKIKTFTSAGTIISPSDLISGIEVLLSIRYDTDNVLKKQIDGMAKADQRQVVKAADELAE
ncbi:hypothetical protein ID866_4739 [Astraeus odoratus]|nr:hypothetical protein ID866_4739 [Astraeus odoratus]